MANEILDILLRLACSSTLAVFAALLLRGTLRERFGAHVAYLVWMLVPVALVLRARPPVGPPGPLSTPLAPLGPALVSASMTASSPIDFNAWMLVAWLVGTALCGVALVGQQRRFVRRL